MPQVGGGAELEEDEDINLMEEPEADEAVEAGDDDQDVSDEDRARTMGWKPFAEYRGDPRRWKPAEEFVRIAESETPVMRDQNRRLQEKVVGLEGQVTAMSGQLSELRNSSAEQVQALREMRALAKKADERGYQRARDELVDLRRQAASDGDPKAVEQISEQITELDSGRSAEAAAISPPPPPAPTIAPEVAAFIARPEVRGWWHTDQVLRDTMLDCHRVVMRKYPAMVLSDQLEHAFARLKAEFPDRFPGDEEVPDMVDERTPTPPTPRQPRAAPSVSRPSAGPARIGRQQSRWEEISDPTERADAKAQFARQQNADAGLSADEFLDIYLDPHADVLAVQAKRRK